MYMGAPFTSLFCFAVAVCSILADYYFIGSVWDDIDRLVACSYIVWLVACSIPANGWRWTAGVFLALVVLPFLYSRNAASKRQWVFRHSLWHLSGMAVQFLVLYGIFHPGFYNQLIHQ